MTDREQVTKEIEEAAGALAATDYDVPTLKGIRAALLAQRVKGMLEAAEIVAKRRMYESACDATYGTVALQAAYGAQLTAALEDIIRNRADELEGE